MATVDTGQQLISFAYGQAAESILFNRLNYQLHTPGIYDGGALSKDDNSTARIGKLTVYTIDSGTSIGMRVQTTQEVTLDVSDTSKPYIVVFFSWNNQFANYADITTKSWSNVDSDDLVLGKCEYDGSGNLVDFDLTRRNAITTDGQDRSDQPFWVKTSEPFDKNVVVNSGDVLIHDDVTTYASDQTVGPLSDTTNGRIDLIYIDVDGSLKVEEGVDAVSPTVPDYTGKYVIAEVSRGSSRTDVKGSDITNIRPNVRLSSLEGVEIDNGNVTVTGTLTVQGATTANGTTTLNGDTTISSGNTFTVDDLTANRLLQSNGSSQLASVADLTNWIAGTTNQVSVSDDGDGTVTLSLPTEVHIDTLDSQSGGGISVNDTLYANNNLSVDEINESVANQGVGFPDGMRVDDIEPYSNGQVTFNTDVNITGDLTVSGTTTTVDTRSVATTDNVIIINDGEVGNGVTNEIAGLRVDRGKANDYMLIFDDTADDTFRIGEYSVRLNIENISGTFEDGELMEADSDTEARVKDVNPTYLIVSVRRGEFVVGDVLLGLSSGATAEISSGGITEIDNTQAVATREDAPTSGGVAYWNNAQSRFDTISDLTVNSGRLIANEGITLGMATTAIAGTIRWNSSESEFQGYDGVEWALLGGGGLLEVATDNLISRPVLEEGNLDSDAQDNIIIGYNAGENLTTQDSNVLIGNRSGRYFEGNNSVAIGLEAGLGSSSTPATQIFTAIGFRAFYAIENTNFSPGVAIGYGAASNLTTGQGNVFVGNSVIGGTTTSFSVHIGEISGSTGGGDDNVFVGFDAGSGPNPGDNNVAIGRSALINVDSGSSENTVVGSESGSYISTGSFNVALGRESLFGNTDSKITGDFNVAIGYQSLYSAETTLASNTAVGGYSGNKLTTGDNNSILGYRAGFALTTGNANIFIGYQAGGYPTGSGITSGSNNIAIGRDSLSSGTTSIATDDNIAIGTSALTNLGASAADNLAIGYFAAYNLASGSRNVFIGRYAGYDISSATDTLVIDNQDRDFESDYENEALIYGIFDSLTDNQELRLNAKILTSLNRNIITYEEDTSFPPSPRNGDIVNRTDLAQSYIYTSNGWVQIA